MSPTTEELIAIARQYWRPDKDYGLGSNPEHHRLQGRWAQALKEFDRWRAMKREIKHELRQELPGLKLKMGDATATPDACFRCQVYPDERTEDGRVLPRPWILVGCASIIAPVYIVYAVEYDVVGMEELHPRVLLEPFPPELRRPAEIIGRKIEATYGYSKVPREIAQTPVPLFVEWVEPPETTLFHALFTNEPDNLP
ncbi:hypothetical protein [Vitiosangium sp. GDMCC 1.1324]|uniref:hypothetical protein n=1 Tax=Vitiosangium sp. (strain GDMCC 1.1324) TaxID=2138576 RepID=UPI000D3AE173|nr:hypothetical protein [Vitiosangium sp. GDMCC 1.1324]PTL83766.1 hypothetical protein DAT35_09835 [Vitiosangium sp. GDMCC 1.1324]